MVKKKEKTIRQSMEKVNWDFGDFNTSKYPLDEQAMDNADVFNRGDGVTANDAASIQKLDAGVIDSLPES